jgi:hypothetical protein
MRRLLVIVILASLTWGLVGCGGSDEPKKDADGKAIKAPDVPPAGP